MGAFRDLFVFAVVVGVLPYALRRPYVGLLLFSWLAYMRPQDLCWSFARAMRFSFFAAAAMVIGYFAHEFGRRPFTRWDIRTVLMCWLLVTITAGLLFAVDQGAYVLRYYFEFVKIILVALFTVGQVTTYQRLRGLLWTICACFAFYGFKGGFIGALSGGSQILRGPGGMLEDNNDFALALVMNVPLLFYLGRLEGKLWLRRLCDVSLVLTAVTIFLTHSRGSAVALVCTVLVLAWRAGSLLKAILGLGLAVCAFFLFAPEHVIERLATLQQGTQEGSAGARIRAWTVALRMIEAYPVIGVGIRNFQDHWHEFSTDLSKGPGFAYVAHNSYLQIWAEGGTTSFFAYMLLLASVFAASWRLRRWGRLRPDLPWLGVYGRMIEATCVGFMTGSFFLNRGHFDLVYHFFALVSCMMFVARDELRQATAAVTVREPPRAEVVPRRAALAGRW
jgi:probable O-glycosylation ligase (exosortase A-associated)